MKKILLTFLVIFSSIGINASFCVAGFLDGDNSLDLYKNIDAGVYKLSAQMTELNLKGNDPAGDIGKQLNKKLGKTCFKEDNSIKETDLSIIAGIGDGNIGSVEDNFLNSSIASEKNDNDSPILKLVNILDDKCYNDKMSISNLSIYINTIQKHLENSRNIGNTNAKNLYSISRIGLYSDGNEDNSPFDLMKDLDDINKIIFTKDIPYDGINYLNNSNALNAFLGGKKGNDIIQSAKIGNNNQNSNNSGTGNNSNNSNPIIGDTASNYVCKTNESGLSDKEYDSIMPNWGTGTKLDKINSPSINAPGDPYSGWNFSGNINIPNKGYSPLDDNAIWPCNEFFCITIEFKMYNQNLFGGGKTNSIQALIERSNGHLKKFTNSSLVQARMTTNNFQLGLRDLSLPDLFNVNFQIDYKAPPILNLNGGNEFKVKILLEEYFKNYGLEYERINDLDIYKKKAGELASVINSAELTVNNPTNNFDEFKNISNNTKLNNVTSRNFDSNIMASDLAGFDKQFVELSGFLANFPRYASELNIIVNKMLNKETGK